MTELAAEMSHNQKTSSTPATTDDDKGINISSGRGSHDEPKTGASKAVQNNKVVRDEAQVVYVKVERPQSQVASNKIQVVYNAPTSRFLDGRTERLCPKGTWEATCWLFFIGCTVALVFFIIDMLRHGKL